MFYLRDAAQYAGSLASPGNGNSRAQFRALSTVTVPANQTLYFSLLLQESVNSYPSGTIFAGFGTSIASGNYGTIPSTGVNFGFVDGALTMFYNNGGTNMTSAADQDTLIATPTVNSTYLAEAAITNINGSTATITPKVYNSQGSLVFTGSPVTGTLAGATDVEQLQMYLTADFGNGGSEPAAVSFDEFRLGTAPSDVVSTPEPASIALATLGAAGLLARRRRAMK